MKTVCDCRELNSHRQHRQDKTVLSKTRQGRGEERQCCLVGVGGVNWALESDVRDITRLAVTCTRKWPTEARSLLREESRLLNRFPLYGSSLQRRVHPLHNSTTMQSTRLFNLGINQLAAGMFTRTSFRIQSQSEALWPSLPGQGQGHTLHYRHQHQEHCIVKNISMTSTDSVLHHLLHFLCKMYK